VTTSTTIAIYPEFLIGYEEASTNTKSDFFRTDDLLKIVNADRQASNGCSKGRVIATVPAQENNAGREYGLCHSLHPVRDLLSKEVSLSIFLSNLDLARTWHRQCLVDGTQARRVLESIDAQKVVL
jgi:hypothetical protein